MKLALIQMAVADSPDKNMERICSWLEKAKKAGADIVVLPEMCACPYENSEFVKYAMPSECQFLKVLADKARELSLYLVAGSIPEAADGKIYNSSFVFDDKGTCIARHRKMHLFDINIEGGQYFMESDVFTPGDKCTTFDTPWGRFGLMICYDIRFPELARLLSLQGARMILVPGAFNMTTGPAHWELSFRMRALDNQVFMAGCEPARDMNASYHAWGHSIVTDPWGEVLAQADEKEGMLVVEPDFTRVRQIREQLPLLKHRRSDLYSLELKACPGEPEPWAH